jgi:ankyrin repeat protein
MRNEIEESEDDARSRAQDELDLALIDAARRGMTDWAFERLAEGASPLAVDELGKTALIWASENADIDLVERLIPVSDVRAQDAGGSSALMLAAMKSADCVRALLPFSDPEATDSSGSTALMCAARDGDAAAARLLAAAPGAKKRNKQGWDALMHAADAGKEGVALVILPFSDPMARNALGDDALTLATARGLATLAKALAPVSDAKAKNELGNTALMIAARVGSDEMVEALLPCSNVSETARDGRAALHVAAAWSGPETLRKMVEAGADPKARVANQPKMTPLMSAASAGKAKNCLFLLPLSDARAASADGATALMMACWDNNPQMEAAVLALLPLSDVNAARVDNQQTALMAAARGGTPAMVKMLLNAGADPLAQDMHGYTALHHAVDNARAAAVAVLAPTCDLDAKTNGERGQTAEGFARRKRETRCLEELDKEKARRAAVAERDALLASATVGDEPGGNGGAACDRDERDENRRTPPRRPLAL